MNTRALRLVVLLLAASALLVCAPPESGEGSPNLQLTMSGVFSANTSQIQITVLTGGDALSKKTDINKQCIKELAADAGSRFLLLRRDESSPRTKSISFDVAETEVKISGIEPGSDYLFVAEALSRKSPPTLLASGRTLYDKFEAKENSAHNITLLGLADGGELAPCDPTVAP